MIVHKIKYYYYFNQIDWCLIYTNIIFKDICRDIYTHEKVVIKWFNYLWKQYKELLC